MTYTFNTTLLKAQTSFFHRLWQDHSKMCMATQMMYRTKTIFKRKVTLENLHWPILKLTTRLQDLPYGASDKESACQCKRHGSISTSGRSPGVRKCNPFQYSYLENPMDGGAWRATVYEVTRSQTWLSNWTCKHKATNLVVLEKR